MSVKINKPKFLVHNYLENLVKEKFGVFVDITHEQYNPPIKNPRNKMIKARTSVFAYNNVQEAITASKEFHSSATATVFPLAVAHSECAIGDVFVKRDGLTRALRRLYRDLANKRKFR